MTVEFLCPACENENRGSLPLPGDTWMCSHCGGRFPAHESPGLKEGRPLARCAICAGERFYRQRDFNQRIGCVIVGVGAALSPFTYGISLLACLAIDFVLYFLLKEATLCYRCGAVYRGVPKNPGIGPFDLHVADVE